MLQFGQFEVLWWSPIWDCLTGNFPMGRPAERLMPSGGWPAVSSGRSQVSLGFTSIMRIMIWIYPGTRLERIQKASDSFRWCFWSCMIRWLVIVGWDTSQGQWSTTSRDGSFDIASNRLAFWNQFKKADTLTHFDGAAIGFRTRLFKHWRRWSGKLFVKLFCLSSLDKHGLLSGTLDSDIRWPSGVWQTIH